MIRLELEGFNAALRDECQHIHFEVTIENELSAACISSFGL